MTTMLDNSSKKLLNSLVCAVCECPHRVEEEGGIILNKDDDYVFVRIKNIHENTQTAYGLYETDLCELKTKIFPKIAEGWKLYASFHTHPMFGASPSSLDINKLFEGFKNNYIYSPIQKTYSITTWKNNNWNIQFITKEELENLEKLDQ